MNLLEHYIIDVVSVKDVTKDYEYGIRQFDKDFQADEAMLQVTLKVNCYGQAEIVKKIWRQSEWEQIKKQGYYMA